MLLFFLVKGLVIKTPPLTEGCLKGIAREKVKSIIESTKDFTLEEAVISPFEIQKADEVFFNKFYSRSSTHYQL